MSAVPDSSLLLSRSLVEDASLAMVREFLAKRKYKRTLETLRSELDTQPTPTTTTAVAKQLGLHTLLLKNNAAAQPYPTLLEVLAAHLLQKMQSKQTTNTEEAAASTEAIQTITPQTIKAASTGKVAFSTTPTSITQTTATPIDIQSNREGKMQKPFSAASQSSTHIAIAPVSSTPTPPITKTSATSGSPLSASAFSASSLNALASMKITGKPPASTTPATTATTTTTTTTQSAASPDVSQIAATRSSSAPKQQQPAQSELLMEDVDVEQEQKEYSQKLQAQKQGSTIIPRSTNPSSTNPAPYVIQPGSSSLQTSVYPSTSITFDEAVVLKTLIFGAAAQNNTQCFTAAWSTQGLYYMTAQTQTPVPPGLGYALVQRDGGPCGLIAAVQATVIKQLLFGSNNSISQHKPASLSDRRAAILSITADEQQHALLEAVVEIMWRAGQMHKQCKMALCNKSNTNYQPQSHSRKVGTSNTPYFADGLTESLSIYTFTSITALRQFLTTHLSTYACIHGPGLILFLYSLVLTRGITTIVNDYDYPASTLIGQHHYCTQEMVNLILTGVAVSNVFDGNKTISPDTPELKGILQRSDIGFLSLFEHYNYIEVGNYYKSPVYPIWVVCSESHYTVLFGLEERISTVVTHKPSQLFDLYYYDELIKQQEEIRLTIDCTQTTTMPSKSKDGLEPPLNECIRTKWGKHTRINWNGTEPIL